MSSNYKYYLLKLICHSELVSESPNQIKKTLKQVQGDKIGELK